jgi:hypothetical protein
MRVHHPAQREFAVGRAHSRQSGELRRIER